MVKKNDSSSLTETLLGKDEGKVNTALDSLFKNSAGPSQATILPAVHITTANSLPSEEVLKLSKRKQKKLSAERAEEAARKARALSSLPPLQKRKRKAEAIETKDNDNTTAEKEEDEEVDNKAEENAVQEEKQIDPAKKKEMEKEKSQRTIFVGNVPIQCAEKPHTKALKRKFAEFGEIESMRFRSMAFSETIPRKAAFITKKFHSNRSVTNAYIVYKSKEAADKALVMDGQVFMDKHLRVDNVAMPKPHDRKRSVFIGSLPFDAEEEELWDFFKDCGTIESVRIVRDKKTNIGKGIAYVQFKKRASVDLALALDDKAFRGKGTLRVQRCKAPQSNDAHASPEKTFKSHRSKEANSKGKPKSIVGRDRRPRTTPRMLEGARASKDAGNKFKIGKTSSSVKHKHKKQRRS
ncbi:hypothetical protein BX666DRAFT_2032824 [Dichotomocladium elegans]|nr:hypothetical protein BX666DRAFT_2032824 [Dichotomocladium elegans]